MRRVVITGASRGLGLEMARQYLAAGDEVAALAREPAASAGLRALAAEHADRLSVHACDVAADASVDAARAELQARWQGVDLLINNAGVGGQNGPLAELDLAESARVLEVNALGPLRVTRALLPLLRNGRKPVIVLVTSRMGSIADNGSGNAWAYRMSKAALNMAGRNLMLELTGQGIATLIVHPGWVRTDLGGPSAPLAPPEAVAKIIATIDREGRRRSGEFLDLDGARLPW
jgi:NAD(P)-dependent dehydrogenase (short-subunit alcohol dehydrogenase family)